MILTFMVEGAKAVISFCIRSAIPGYMVVPRYCRSNAKGNHCLGSFMVEGAKAVISFCIRSAIPGYHHVPRYCRSNAKGNHCLGSFYHEGQDHLSPRTKILRLDWWFHLGFF